MHGDDVREMMINRADDGLSAWSALPFDLGGAVPGARALSAPPHYSCKNYVDTMVALSKALCRRCSPSLPLPPSLADTNYKMTTENNQ